MTILEPLGCYSIVRAYEVFKFFLTKKLQKTKKDVPATKSIHLANAIPPTAPF